MKPHGAGRELDCYRQSSPGMRTARIGLVAVFCLLAGIKLNLEKPMRASEEPLLTLRAFALELDGSAPARAGSVELVIESCWTEPEPQNLQTGPGYVSLPCRIEAPDVTVDRVGSWARKLRCSQREMSRN